jgi:hypothetical protein
MFSIDIFLFFYEAHLTDFSLVQLGKFLTEEGCFS